jgi:uncharacterized protein YpbB
MCHTSQVSDWLQLLQTKPEVAKQKIIEEIPHPPKLPKGATKQISLEMYRAGKTVEQIAQESNLAKSTIEGHLLAFIPTGEIDISVFVTPSELSGLQKFIQENPGSASSAIFAAFEGKYSYSQVKAAMALQKNTVKD